MAKSDQQEARGTARNLASQAQTQLAPVITGQQDLQKGAVANQAQTFGSSTGDFSDAAKTYRNFADTGGFTDADKTAYLNRATSGVTGTYDVLAKQAERQRMAAGGLGTGGEISQMARQLGQAQSSATRDAQVNLNQQVNQNKLAGAGGLADVARGEGTLYNTATGEVSEMGRQVLQSLGLQFSTQEEAMNLLARLSNTPGILDNIQRIGGMVAGGLGAVAGLSDLYIKRNVRKIGSLNGINIYKFNFPDDLTERVGVMAQEVQRKFPEDVLKIGDYLHVDYESLVLKLYA